jgi:hypothetical protein
MRLGATAGSAIGLACLLLTLAPGVARADVVHLRGGGSITGEIVELTDTQVKVDIGAGRMTVQRSTVERITEGESPLSNYRSMAAKLAPDDVDGWRALGQWALAQGLNAQAREAFKRVLAVFPNDVEANQAIGRVFFDGRWMTEEESYRAQGFVQFEGQWMSADERQVILDERRVAEEQSQREFDATVAAVAEAQAAREREKAEFDERFYAGSQWPTGSGVVYWDAGMAPNLVPDQPALDASWP